MSSEEFSCCTLTPVAGNESDKSSSSSVVKSLDGKWKASSFYLDSSGRSSISLPLKLQFRSRTELNKFILCECFNPIPSNYYQPTTDEQQEEGTEGLAQTSDGKTSSLSLHDNVIRSIGIEAKVTLTFGTGSARTATVEGVTILSTRLGNEVDQDNNCLYFNTEIIIRVVRGQEATSTSSVNNKGVESDVENSGVKTNLEITAVFSERSRIIPSNITALEAVKSFNLHGFTEYDDSSPDRNVKETRINPSIALHVELTHAISISVQSFDGPRMGFTFLALTMSHSNTHHQPVTITSIALHPGHSKYKQDVDLNTNIDESNNSHHLSKSFVADMSKSVKWGYAQKSDPRLPLTLERHEAFSTILTVDASEDTFSKICSCPLSITAIIGNKNQDRHYYVVAAVEAQWTTSPAAIEPSDSFRIEMSFADDMPCIVGAPLTVLLDVYNLSMEPRHLMLLVDGVLTSSQTASNNANSLSPTSRRNSTTTKSVVVSEQGGYKFGIWGLSPVSTPARDTPDEREFDLIAVDVALLLGEVKGQSSTKAKLRVVPLTEGTLRLPSFKLVDNRTGRRYNCIHRLDAIAVAAAGAAPS